MQVNRDQAVEGGAPEIAQPTGWLARHKEVVWGQMPLIALIVLILIATLLSDRFLSPINMVNVLVQGAIMTVIVIGMTFVIVGGGFDLSVGSVVALSGIATAWVMLETNVAFGVVAGIKSEGAFASAAVDVFDIVCALLLPEQNH